MSNSEDVSSSHNHAAISLLQPAEHQRPSKMATPRHPQQDIRNSNESFKSTLESLGIKQQNLREQQFPSILGNLDYIRSFYNNQDQGLARSSYSSIEILGQIFPGRSKTTLESLLKVYMQCKIF